MPFSQLQLLGNVGRDPELNVTPDGTPVTKFTIAVNHKSKGKPDETTWYTCIAWRGLAETIEKYVHKGDMLFVQGELIPRSYTTREGKPGFTLEVSLDKFAFAGGAKKQEQGSPSNLGDPFLPDLPDDLP